MFHWMMHTESADTTRITRWIITLLAIFQSRLFLTNSSLDWFLRFIALLLRYIGKYSPPIAEIAANLPQSMYHYNRSLESLHNFMKQAVCLKYDTLYKFEDCFKKTAFNTAVKNCSYKPFNKVCGYPLMKVIMSSSGTKKMYRHKIYTHVSLISSLQTLLLRSGFSEMCESTRNKFSGCNHINTQ